MVGLWDAGPYSQLLHCPAHMVWNRLEWHVHLTSDEFSWDTAGLRLLAQGLDCSHSLTLRAAPDLWARNVHRPQGHQQPWMTGPHGGAPHRTGCRDLAVCPTSGKGGSCGRAMEMLAPQVCTTETESLDLERGRPIYIAALHSKSADKSGGGRVSGHGIWISVFLRTKGFLCFMEENGLEQGKTSSFKLGNLK